MKIEEISEQSRKKAEEISKRDGGVLVPLYAVVVTDDDGRISSVTYDRLNDVYRITPSSNWRTHLKEIYKRIFHKHTYVKIGFREVENAHSRYSMRLYECTGCGKKTEVDGRYDTIGNH